LRERREDIEPLATHLAAKIGDAMGRVRVRIEPAAYALLRAAPWPGNVRELAETLEKLVAYSPDGDVTRERVREVFGDSPDDVASLRRRRREEQREELVSLLEACGGNLAEVARRLNVSRGAVIYRAQKHGLLARRGGR
jgi:two-component system response regulator GlrR